MEFGYISYNEGVKVVVMLLKFLEDININD